MPWVEAPPEPKSFVNMNFLECPRIQLIFFGKKTGRVGIKICGDSIVLEMFVVGKCWIFDRFGSWPLFFHGGSVLEASLTTP